jgi:hypothetical protein
MSLTEESEEQAIDRLLQEMGIRLPEINLEDEEPSPPVFNGGVDLAPLSEEINEQLRSSYSS